MIELYERNKRVTSRELARRLGQHEVTIRNLTRVLKALDLIETREGPSGGYRPTIKAYELVKNPGGQILVNQVPVVALEVEGVMRELYLLDLELLGLNDPRGARAVIKAYGDVGGVRKGSRVRLGPLPYSRVAVEGVVDNVDESRNEMLIRVTRIVGIPELKVSEVMSSDLVSVSQKSTVREVAAIMLRHGFRAIPVVEEGKVLGVVFTKHVISVSLNGDLDKPVGELMTREYYTIGRDEDLLLAIKIMREKGVGRLLVLNERGDAVGILTRTDILKALAGLLE